MFRAATFGERPRQAQTHTWQAANTGVQEFLTGKTRRIKRVQKGVRDTTTWLGIFLELNAVDSDVLSRIGVK